MANPMIAMRSVTKIYASILLLTDILLMWNVANSMDSMELSTAKGRGGI